MRVITVIGPTGSGKSALVDAMGAFDGRASTLEISPTLRISEFTFIDEQWCAIDIAGGADHMGHAAPSMAASDAVIVCVPPEADAAVLAAPYLRLVEEAEVPAFVFVNRMDAASERVRDIIGSLQVYSTHPLVLRQIPIRDGSDIVGAVDLISERAWKYREGQPSDLIEIPETVADREESARTELLESLADFDDGLLEELIEDKRPPTEELFEITSRLAEKTATSPVFLGSALHTNGVFRLLKSLRHEAPDISVTASRLGVDNAAAIGFLADNKKHAGKTVVLRAISDGVAAGSTLAGGNIGSLTALDGKTQVTKCEPGSVAVAVKSDHLNAGRVFTTDGDFELPDWASMRAAAYRRIIVPENERDETRLSTALQRVQETDTGLAIVQDETTGRAILCAQGPLHAREVMARLDETFGIKVVEEELPPEFRETISKSVEKRYRHRKQSGGAGQFADIVIQVKPLARGAGFEFDETVKGGAVPRNYIPAVGHGVEDALAKGPNGHRVVDVAVTLTDGKSHSVDSSDFAFRTAGKMGMQEALTEASPVVLQPIERVDVHVPSIYAGSLAPKISSLKGQVLGFEAHPTAAGWDVFSALMPASSRDELFRALGSSTRGTAWAEARFDHYEEVYGADAKAAVSA